MKVAIYTPTYLKSPGTRYKVDMLRSAVARRHDAILVCDRSESHLRFAYRLLAPSLFSRRSTWERVGRRISGQVLEEKPDAVILITDIAAGALPFLKESGVRTILSIEDLTSVWLKMSDPGPFLKHLRYFSGSADGIITVSDDLKGKLEKIGIPSQVVPHGLERIYVTEEEALGRIGRGSSASVLQAGQVNFLEEKKAFEASITPIAKKYPVFSYSFGKYSQKLREEFPSLTWYDLPSPEEAITRTKSCSVGLVIRYNAERPTRLFYHASMLQPIVAIGGGWTKEVEGRSIGISSSPEGALEAVDKIVSDYAMYVKSVKAFAEQNLLERAYAPLMKMLG